MECAAICDVLKTMDTKLEEEVAQAKKLLKEIVSILTVVCRKR